MPNKQNNALQMEHLIAEFQKNLKKLEDPGYSSMEWGSCQYDAAKAAYDFVLQALRLDRLLFEKLFKVTYSKESTLDEMLDEMRNSVKALLDEDPEDEYLQELHEDLSKITTIEEYYEVCRHNSYDLWSAIHPAFGNFEITPMELPIFGPILNQMSQGENWITGVHAAYTTFLFGVDESAFMDFDT